VPHIRFLLHENSMYPLVLAARKNLDIGSPHGGPA
jgi:hypothetical protein